MAVIRSIVNDIRRMRMPSVMQEDNSKTNKREAVDGQTILTSFPRRLFLEMTSACNINCKMCGRNANDFVPTFLNPDWLKYLEPVAKYAEELTLMGWGEPTIHPSFSRFLEWGFDRGLSIYFCTNGTMLGKIHDDIFKYHVDLITVSLDGADAKTNNAIRCGADFDSVVGHIKDIQTKKQLLSVNYPYLSMVMTIMKSNLYQLPDYVRLAHSLGISEVKAVFLTVFEQRMMDESLLDQMDHVKSVFDETVIIGQQLGVDVKLPYLMGNDPAEDLLHKECHMAWRDFYIGSDGYVRPCMHTSRKLFRIDKYSSFDEMWNSVEYQEFRSNVNCDGMDSNCRNCYHATYGNWNRRECFVQIGRDFSPEWEKKE